MLFFSLRGKFLRSKKPLCPLIVLEQVSVGWQIDCYSYCSQENNWTVPASGLLLINHHSVLAASCNFTFAGQTSELFNPDESMWQKLLFSNRYEEERCSSVQEFFSLCQENSKPHTGTKELTWTKRKQAFHKKSSKSSGLQHSSVRGTSIWQAITESRANIPGEFCENKKKIFLLYPQSSCSSLFFKEDFFLCFCLLF